MSLYHDQGVVLRTHKLGEADRIVTLLTKDRGKVRAVAKGVRKTKSRFGGRLEPVSHVRLLVYEGRDPGRLRPARPGRVHARGGRPAGDGA
jgi:DNA repair protein RecO (recombination protein O)